MEFIVLEDPVIQCACCSTQYRIPKDELEYDNYLISEFGMGARFEHVFRFEGTCDNCGSQLSFALKGNEYPVGAFEYQDSEADRCEIKCEPPMEIKYLSEPVLSVYEQILYEPQSVYSLEPWEFDELVAEVFQRNGFNAEATQRTCDGGKDIVATFEMGGVVYRTHFECKQNRPNRPVDVTILRNLYAAMDRDRIDKGVIVTTSYFTRDAIKEAKMLNGWIQLIDNDELQRLMRTQP